MRFVGFRAFCVGAAKIPASAARKPDGALIVRYGSTGTRRAGTGGVIVQGDDFLLAPGEPASTAACNGHEASSCRESHAIQLGCGQTPSLLSAVMTDLPTGK